MTASEDKEYLVEAVYDLLTEDEYRVDKYESKGNGRRYFFKVDSEGFVYKTLERPVDIPLRDDYVE